MKKIKTLSKKIRGELEDAKSYALLALEEKDPDKSLSDSYRQLAEKELDDANKLHAQGVRIINDYRASGHEAPVPMQAVWNWEHENMIEETTRIRLLLQELR